jgi:hypothetical protein
MGQKVHPYGFRVGTRPWTRRGWHARGKGATARTYVRTEDQEVHPLAVEAGGLSKIEIERTGDETRLICTRRTGSRRQEGP